MSGTINVARSLFDHPCFADEPMTEREAWVWLIAEASWKARTVRVGAYVIDLERGQVCHSVRFMAGAWQWTPARVQRFITKLKRQEMISQKTDTPVTIITICNYNKFQAQNGEADTAPIQRRYSADTEKKKDERRKEEEGGGGGSREADLPDDPTDRERFLRAIGADPVSGIIGPNGRMIGTTADMAEAARWLALPGLTVPVICAELRRLAESKRDGPPSSFRYFSGAMERLSGALSAPPLTPQAPRGTYDQSSSADSRRADRAERDRRILQAAAVGTTRPS